MRHFAWLAVRFLASLLPPPMPGCIVNQSTTRACVNGSTDGTPCRPGRHRPIRRPRGRKLLAERRVGAVLEIRQPGTRRGGGERTGPAISRGEAVRVATRFDPMSLKGVRFQLIKGVN